LSQGTAILSLDCEGKWGVADHLALEHHAGLGEERLRWAYREVTHLLDRHQVAATFAFVELFLRSPKQLRAVPLDELARELPYLRAASDAIVSGDEGWSGIWALDMIGPRHEIAFHGYTHVPWSDLTAEQARRELELTPEARRRTMVFPRNRVAHLDVLSEFGCIGYRAERRHRSRLSALLSEFDVRTASEPVTSEQEAPMAIPAGIFVNWRGGLRRIVPPAVTRLRARNFLRGAGRRGGVAHFWLHPENIATHPATLVNFAAVVEEIRNARDAGLVVVKTQLQHCSALSEAAHPGHALGHAVLD
jgi:hypothetical protein